MKYLLSLLPILLISCASHTPFADKVVVNEIDYTQVISVLSPIGATGHACPCDETIYTARHVAQRKTITGYFSYPPEINYLTWQNRRGGSGYAYGSQYNIFKDLATIELLDYEQKFFYPKAKELPGEGERVSWVEYDPDNYNQKIRESTVVFYFADYVFFKDLPTPGASGSCLFNSKGEVIGIVVWGAVRSGNFYGVGALLPINE